MPDKNSNLPVPTLNMNVGVPESKKELVAPEKLLNYFDTIFADIEESSKITKEVLDNFMEMIMNKGDASSSSKEALVNLLRLYSETSDKKTKVVDLMMRAYLKESNTFPKYLAAHQHNEFKISSDTSEQRKIIKSIQAEKDQK